MSFNQPKSHPRKNLGSLIDKFGFKRPIRAVKVKGAIPGGLVFAVKTPAFPQIPAKAAKFLDSLSKNHKSFEALKVEAIRGGITEVAFEKRIDYYTKKGFIKIPPKGSIKLTDKGKAVLAEALLRGLK